MICQEYAGDKLIYEGDASKCTGGAVGPKPPETEQCGERKDKFVWVASPWSTVIENMFETA